jgi:hypothetical protein
MINRRATTVVATLILLAAARGIAAPDLTDATYERWRDFVLPKPNELGYRSIAWRTSFWDAVVEAQNQDKPILLWAMNGHPLACT